jgi:ABC-type multidrug transport system ATPase subunit
MIHSIDNSRIMNETNSRKSSPKDQALDLCSGTGLSAVCFIHYPAVIDTMNHLLEIDSVILEFGSRRVLQDVYLRCETNTIVGLLGRNGAGKSCLMNIIFGTLKPFNGLVRINNLALLGSSRKSEDVMFLPQFNVIPKFLTLKRIFEDYRLEFSSFKSEFPEFEKYYRSKIGTLSGGERRIVEIYLFLSSKTRFCLLDEPFSHVMPLHVERIKELIKKESKNKGIIVTDHMYDHILDICEPIYLLKEGKTHLIDQTEELEQLEYAKLKAKTGNVN